MRRRAIFLSVSAIALVVTLVIFRAVLFPFALAILLAYVFAPAVDFCERLSIYGRKLPRAFVVVAFYLGLVSVLTLTGLWAAPRLIGEAQKIVVETPEWVRRAKQQWLPQLHKRIEKMIAPYAGTRRGAAVSKSEPPLAPQGAITIRPGAEGSSIVSLPAKGIVVRREGEHTYRITMPHPVKPDDSNALQVIARVFQYVSNNAEAYTVGVLRVAQRTLVGFVKGIFTFFVTLMLSAYLLLTRDSIFAFFKTLVRPNRRERFDALIRSLDAGLSGVVRGQLLICLINGVLSGIGFYLADLQYWPILTLIATVFSIIPIFGAILSSVPAVLIGLHQSFGTALFVLVWIVVIHQIEANLLNPKILGDSAKVHPVLVVFALLGGEHLFGIAGALFAVPVLSVVQTVFLHYRDIAMASDAAEG